MVIDIDSDDNAVEGKKGKRVKNLHCSPRTIEIWRLTPRSLGQRNNHYWL